MLLKKNSVIIVILIVLKSLLMHLIIWGNFDVPFIYNEFDSIKKEVVSISKFEHQDIFGEQKVPSIESIKK